MAVAAINNLFGVLNTQIPRAAFTAMLFCMQTHPACTFH